MSYANYKKILLDAAKDTTLQGKVTDANFVGSLVNFSCQDSVVITAKISEAGEIVQVLYESSGCLLSRASCSLLLAYAIGKPLQQIQLLTDEDFLHIVPVDDFAARKDCFLLGLNAIKSGCFNELYAD